MENNPTNEHREQAREIARFFFHGDPLPTIGGRVWASAQSSPEAALADYIAEALSSRDIGIREVLEGLALRSQFDRPCWCRSELNLGITRKHEDRCLAARALWTKLPAMTWQSETPDANSVGIQQEFPGPP